MSMSGFPPDPAQAEDLGKEQCPFDILKEYLMSVAL